MADDRPEGGGGASLVPPSNLSNPFFGREDRRGEYVIRCARGRLGRRAGLTLLELLLSLALTTLVMAAIIVAIDLHLRSLDVHRTEVEEGQLAQALLQMIARDLRCAVQPPAAAEELNLDELLASGAAEELQQAAGIEAPTSGNETASESENVQGIADSTAVPATLGLFGNQYELQVDISRLPRVEQYQQLLTAGDGITAADIPSDIKTVAYYVLPPGTAVSAAAGGVASPGGQQGLGGDNPLSGGLVRRELDRAVTLWALESGGVNRLEANAELIAPEVAALEFQYFDGSQWLTEWDSDQLGGLPAAVQIVITLRSATDGQGGAVLPATDADAGSSAAGGRMYRLVVPLPVGKSTSQETAGLEELGL